MDKLLFQKLFEDRIVMLDGATGSNLIACGMPIGVCTEKWILDNPKHLIKLQREYIKSGSNIILAPTFTANRIKLAEYGLSDKVKEINTNLVELSKQAVSLEGQRGYIAGDITMTGKQLKPIGDLELEELIDVYKEQATALYEAGVDLFVVETMMSLAEARAAVIAIKEVCDLPIMVSLTFNEDGKTLFGSTPEASVVVLQSLGASAVGINCSTGPKEMQTLIKEMLKYAKVPIFAKPNNGKPELIDGKTSYRMTPEEFAQLGRELVDLGVNAIGGCCGTTPKHISVLKSLVRGCIPFKPSPKYESVVCSESKVVTIDIDGSFMVIGERINPTGKKKLQEELRNNSLSLALKMAEEQTSNGAKLLDVNMGMNGIDESAMMERIIYELPAVTDLPLSIDSSYIEVIEKALRIYPGRALINSISYENSKCRPLMKIAAKYGAMVILLPLSDNGLPESLDEKKDIIHKLLQVAKEEGVSRDSIVIDGLVTTVGANKFAALETLETIRYCKEELKLPTVCGLSNISFGLPERINVNTAFLTMAIASGLTMAICNPDQATLMNASLASDLLLAKDNSDNNYVENVVSVTTESAMKSVTIDNEKGSLIYNDVVKGNKSDIEAHIKDALDKGAIPQDIIDKELIPAVTKVGQLFEDKKYFLPQLIAGATAMDMAVTYLTPYLKVDENIASKGTVIMATVEGDIHDIGKNLVVLMLKNYGYRVIDLGKDVKKDVIIETAIKENADIIGLSALMTTTMMRMKEVCQEICDRKLPFKIIVGGAVVSQSFADEIGAHGYSEDANEAVKVVDRLLSK
ncbi:MAG: homocysteine S-methyltransferase family protein [Lachnospiraceae bacterium]|nr:homocysteine S-methyltransferase family protein [Lachnospiraceae bacterium]